jgi:phage/plasmid-like protein (TIGR03299 family)
MSIQQILTDSKTNWTVSKLPLYGPGGEPTPAYGVFRTDTNNCLGVVGDRYSITQNAEVLELLFEAAAQVNVNIERGGILKGGAKVYYQLGLQDVTIGGSPSKRFLTALTSHDGSSPIGFGATNVVVVCANTFFSALKDVQKVRHTTNSRLKLNEIIGQLRNSMAQEEQMVEHLMMLSKVNIPEAVTDELLLQIIGGDEDTTRTKNRLAAIRSAIVPEFATHGNTAYGLFNAVTRYTNHLINYPDIEAKRNSLMTGVAFKTNTKALEVITDTFTGTITVPEYHIMTP